MAVNSFTIADLTLTVTVAQIEMIGFDLEPFSRIRTWLQRCKDHLRPHGYDVNIVPIILTIQSKIQFVIGFSI